MGGVLPTEMLTTPGAVPHVDIVDPIPHPCIIHPPKGEPEPPPTPQRNGLGEICFIHGMGALVAVMPNRDLVIVTEKRDG